MATWLVVGLGNPGPTYASHRHNVGFMVVDELARRAGAGFTAPKGMRADVCETRVSAAGVGAPAADAQRLVLVKPRTYMNESGQAVGKLTAFHKIPVSQVVAVHDELDLDLGMLRLKCGGGDNGHNGLKSMRAHLRSGDFFRVRFGIGRPPGRQAPADFVLSSFPAAQRVDLEIDVSRAADAVESLVVEGLSAAQNRFNA
ncbi:aminoacyl-tRNA hydrolase [Mariniluteicoccus endophyticus]